MQIEDPKCHNEDLGRQINKLKFLKKNVLCSNIHEDEEIPNGPQQK